MARKQRRPERVPFGTFKVWNEDQEYTRLLEYVGYDGETYYGRPIDWRLNEPFKASLELVDYSRGRSAVTFHWRNRETGERYPMFGVDLVELVQTYGVVGGYTDELTWQVRKRGANYGIAVVQPE